MKYTFFLRVHGTHSGTDYVLGHETNLNRFKRIDIILSIFSGNNMKVDLNQRIRNEGGK